VEESEPRGGVVEEGGGDEFGERKVYSVRRSWVRKSIDKSSFIEAPSRRRRLVYRFRKRGVLRSYRNIKNESAARAPTINSNNNNNNMYTSDTAGETHPLRGVRSAHGRVFIEKWSRGGTDSSDASTANINSNININMKIRRGDTYKYSTFMRKMSVEQITLGRRKTEPLTAGSSTPWDDPEHEERPSRKQLDLSPTPWEWAILSSPSATAKANAICNGRGACPRSR